jgi:hypothetical protein
MITAILLFCIAALAGITMIVLRVQGRPIPPTPLAIAHGLVALSGFTVLVHAWATVGLPGYARVATVIFALGALGGATLFLGFHVRGRALPLGLMLTHGLFAAAGLGTLLIGMALAPRGSYPPTVPTPATFKAPASDKPAPSQP